MLKREADMTKNEELEYNRIVREIVDSNKADGLGDESWADAHLMSLKQEMLTVGVVDDKGQPIQAVAEGVHYLLRLYSTMINLLMASPMPDLGIVVDKAPSPKGNSEPVSVNDGEHYLKPNEGFVDVSDLTP